MPFPQWTPATTCSGSATAGAQALMRWIIEEYGPKGLQNWGIYNCRDVRGGATTSLHGEGRALDVGHAVGDPDADELRKRLLRRVGRLGIQAIIHERVIYSAKSPEGRPYTGVAPHYDHLHIELTEEAAQNLTYATVRAVLSKPKRRAGERPLKQGAQGADVRWLQRKLRVEVDGKYGAATAKAVEAFERKVKDSGRKGFKHLKVDGVVGRKTWLALGVKPTF